MDKEYTPAEAKAWLAGYESGKVYAGKEWVGLTEDEFTALHYELKVQTQGGISTLGIYRILEAKLKEKNAKEKN
jgi:hypothetical protein